MTITQMRAMMRRFGLWAAPFVGVVLLVYCIRRRRQSRRVFVVFSVMCVAALTGAAMYARRSHSLYCTVTHRRLNSFSIQDLGIPAGYSSISARSINIKGEIVGYVSTDGGQNSRRRPFVWKSGTLSLLDTGPMQSGAATCIDDAGDIVGYTSDSKGNSRAAMWTNTRLRLLESPFGRSTYALHLNNKYQVCGISTDGQSTDAVVWNHGNIQTIHRCGSSATCEGMNDGGEVVGTELIGSFVIEGFHYVDGHISRLPNFGGSGDGARSINVRGDIAGWAEYDDSWDCHAALWAGKNGGIQDLGTLGGASSSAMAINNLREIVGWAQNAAGATCPFLWRSGKMVDINSLLPQHSGWNLEYAFAINDCGQIIGIGRHNNQARAFVLTPQ